MPSDSEMIAPQLAQAVALSGEEVLRQWDQGSPAPLEPHLDAAIFSLGIAEIESTVRQSKNGAIPRRWRAHLRLPVRESIAREDEEPDG